MACSDISAATFPGRLFIYTVETNHGSSPVEVWVSSPTSEEHPEALKRLNQTDLIVRSPIPPLDVWLRSPVSSHKSSDCSFETEVILKSTTVVYFPSPQFVELFVKRVSINLHLPVCFLHDESCKAGLPFWSWPVALLFQASVLCCTVLFLNVNKNQQ